MDTENKPVVAPKKLSTGKKSINGSGARVYTSNYQTKDGIIKTYNKVYVPSDRAVYNTDKKVQAHIKLMKKHRDNTHLKLVLEYIESLNINYTDQIKCDSANDATITTSQ